MDSLIDSVALAGWMDSQGLTGGPIGALEPIAGGTQNILLRFSRGGREFVLRRGPRHLRPRSNDALRREMRVLDALAPTDVPHPRLISACADETIMGGAVFYLMEPVHGFNPMTGLPELHAGDADVRRQMAMEAVDALARLAAVDHIAVGLGDMGRPEGFLERQVPRWLSELDGYRSFDGYPGPDISGVDVVAGWLERNRPRSWLPGILHGDYHLANLLFAYDGPRVVAIVDWEMCTIGDPLLDLGWLLATWPVGDDTTATLAGPMATAGGLPSPEELVVRYARHSARDLSAITWYTVLACFKLGIVLEGTHARACAGKADIATGDLLHAMTLGLFARARMLIAG